ncbi:MAG: chemotaxis protein CheW [Myxococcota bacterium]
MTNTSDAQGPWMIFTLTPQVKDATHEHTRYCIDVSHVQQVAEFTFEQLTWVPLAPPCITGITNYRGHIITIIDTATFLGLSCPCPVSGFTIVLRQNDGSPGNIGLSVDTVVKIVPDDELKTTDVPTEPSISTIVQYADSLIHRIDYDHFLDHLLKECSTQESLNIVDLETGRRQHGTKLKSVLGVHRST